MPGSSKKPPSRGQRAQAILANEGRLGSDPTGVAYSRNTLFSNDPTQVANRKSLFQAAALRPIPSSPSPRKPPSPRVQMAALDALVRGVLHQHHGGRHRTLLVALQRSQLRRSRARSNLSV